MGADIYTKAHSAIGNFYFADVLLQDTFFSEEQREKWAREAKQSAARRAAGMPPEVMHGPNPKPPPLGVALRRAFEELAPKEESDFDDD